MRTTPEIHSPANFTNAALSYSEKVQHIGDAHSNKEKPVYSIARDFAMQKQSNMIQNNYITQLEEVIKDKNDSLNYARFLQDAMIPSKKHLTTVFPESFVYHAPKDIVSGDFFWHHEMGDVVFLAAVDCTGHGVPGAMMTMVCNCFLKRAVLEFGIMDPGRVLNKVREMIIHLFANSDMDMSDGMDMSLCTINKRTHIMEWSGANNSLLYFHNNELLEINGDKQPVGKYEKYAPFTTHTRLLSKGDTLYMFSDGYADQFGGEKGKKFMYKQMKQLLTKIAPLDIQTQHEQVVSTFENWKGSLEQTDDVLMIGVRV